MIENDETFNCNCVSNGNKKTIFIFPENQEEISKITFLFEGLTLEDASLEINGQEFWIRESDIPKISVDISTDPLHLLPWWVKST